MSTFLVLHTAVTSAPSALASWTANVPTPPVDQDLAVAGLRLVDLPELKHIRGAAPVVDDGLHR